MIRKIVLGIAGLVALAVVAGLGGYFWILTSLPKTSGSVPWPGSTVRWR